VVDLNEKYDRVAEGFSQSEYRNPAHYNRRRAEAVFAVGPPLPPGALVLDLGCGDASFADEVLGRGYRYIGVDPSAGMCTAAMRRVGDRGTIAQGDFLGYTPAEPVDMTVMLRALYLIHDRVEVLRRIGEYSRVKVVFDLSARQLPLERVAHEVRRAGFSGFEVRPMLVSMRLAPPRPVDAVLRALERSGPAGRALAARRFRFCCAAFQAE
jgi:ubiquinone/menaquinone biosynthesis C-methylase UbiE